MGNPDIHERDRHASMDFYGILGLSRDAKPNDIQKAYRKLALTFHPDKFVDEELRHKAQLSFRDIKHAYDVLSNEGSRNIYDRYGYDAVDLYLNMQLGSDGKKSHKDFVLEYMRAKRIQHLNYLREKVTHEGSVVTLVYAGQIFDYRRKKFISPSILSFSVKQGLRFPIRDKHELRVSGHLVTSNGFGDGSIKLRYTHNFSPLTNVSLASSTSWNVMTLHARVWRQVTDDIAAGLRVGLIGDHNVRLTLDKELSDNLKASAEMEWSQNPSVSVGLGKENEEGTFYTGSVTTSKKNMGVTASAGLQVTEKTSIGGSMNLKSKYEFSSLESVLSMLKFTFSGHVERSISEITKAHVAFTIANYGVYISFGITRLGQTYQLPLYISNRVTVSSVMTAFMYPLSIVYLVNALFVVPKRRRRLLEKQTKRREELNKLIKTYKEKADAFKESIAIDVKKMQEMEDEKGGLVIIQAFYGKPPEMNQTINEESISAEDCVIDVTLPLQYMVRNSKLQLPETSKSHLVGFYDPCPGEEKTLEIVYLFRNQMHRVTIPDTARLRIPIKSHRLSDPDQM